MWKFVAESVAGTRHLRNGQPCEDACAATLAWSPHGPALVLVAADGAGTASLAEVGARRTCERLVELVRVDLGQGQTAAGIDRDAVLYWLTATRQHLAEEAERRAATLRDLACTVIVAVVAADAAAFAQIGDGGIVVTEGDRYRPVFWPDAHEYANATHFLTEPDFEQHTAFAQWPNPVEELAVFTDGLQRLVLDYTARSGHAGFFGPVFRQLRAATDLGSLAEAFRLYLDSPGINRRSDDDKTLLLATRVPARAADPDPA